MPKTLEDVADLVSYICALADGMKARGFPLSCIDINLKI
jgi:hypothetical protein